MKLRGKMTLLIMALLAATGIWYAFFRKPAVAYDLRTGLVESSDITATVMASGKLNAVSIVEVGTQVSGTIKEIHVDFNSPVKEGQLIAELDQSVLRSALIESRASLVVSEAGVTSARASLTDAERKQRRSKELYSRNLISKSEFEDAETQVILKRAELKEAQARVVQAKAGVERARTNLQYTQITSPVDGVIISRQVDVGQTVAASFQTPTLFTIARDLTRMQIDTRVDEADIGFVREGQDVDFRVDAFPEETFAGKVVQVRIAPETMDNVVTYTVVIHVDNRELLLKPGMTANVSIKTRTHKNVLRIPSAALRFKPPQDLLEAMSTQPSQDVKAKAGLNSGYIWLVSDGKLTRRVFVQTGLTDGNWTEIISGDATVNDKVATSAVEIDKTKERR